MAGLGKVWNSLRQNTENLNISTSKYCLKIPFHLMLKSTNIWKYYIIKCLNHEQIFYLHSDWNIGNRGSKIRAKNFETKQIVLQVFLNANMYVTSSSVSQSLFEILGVVWNIIFELLFSHISMKHSFHNSSCMS